MILPQAAVADGVKCSWRRKPSENRESNVARLTAHAVSYSLRRQFRLEPPHWLATIYT